MRKNLMGPFLENKFGEDMVGINVEVVNEFIADMETNKLNIEIK